DAGAGPHLSGQLSECPEFVGHTRSGDWPGGPQIRRERPRQHHDRGKCRVPGRHDLSDDGCRHAAAHFRPRLRASPTRQLVSAAELSGRSMNQTIAIARAWQFSKRERTWLWVSFFVILLFGANLEKRTALRRVPMTDL